MEIKAVTMTALYVVLSKIMPLTIIETHFSYLKVEVFYYEDFDDFLGYNFGFH